MPVIFSKSQFEQFVKIFKGDRLRHVLKAITPKQFFLRHTRNWLRLLSLLAVFSKVQ